MTALQHKQTPSGDRVLRRFKRREFLPMIENLLWQIDEGFVRTLTLHEDGTVSTLGLWGAGDIVGRPLAGVELYQIECLSQVKVHRLQKDNCVDLDQVLWSHVHQSQTLLSMHHGPVLDRLQRLFPWLAQKFGIKCDEGCRLSIRLTHQDIAEVIGTSRVTVTRTIGELEQAGLMDWSKRRCLLFHDFYSASPAFK